MIKDTGYRIQDTEDTEYGYGETGRDTWDRLLVLLHDAVVG